MFDSEIDAKKTEEMNEQLRLLLKMSDKEIEDHYSIKVREAVKLNGEQYYVASFHSLWLPGSSIRPEVEVTGEFYPSENTLHITNRPTQADQSLFGEFWDTRLVPIVNKYVKQYKLEHQISSQ